ncbi:MAG: GBS Bsp-like repeat-containing protein, partial [Eubacterium sp.]|nr:GBS Bsp-like repeat-containing protein [Eubacterium sp.]
MKKKRLVSLVMVVVLMISVLQGIPGTRFSWNKDAYAADGAYADDIVDKDDETDLLGNPATKTVDQAIDWCKSKVGQSIDVDGYPYNQCVDFIKAYYQYLGASPVLGDGKDYSWNSLPSGWTRVQGGAPQRGDILVYGASESNSAGHVAIYESEYSTYHQNFGNNGMITRETYRYNGFTNPYWGYIRPQWENDNHPWGTVDTISSDNGEVTFRGWAFDLDNTSKAISIHVYIDGPAGTGRMFSSGTANKERTDVNDKYGTGKNHGYEFSVPTNITGSHSFYVYAINIDKNGGNGGGYLHNPEIGNRTIIVKGDTEKPVISDVEIIDKSETGYTVKFKATDNNKIDRVQCPTWTTKNDQDDIVKDWQNSTAVKATSLGNNMYQFKVKTSDHNNELGQYRTHIYAYDPAGNYVNYSLNNIIVSDTPIPDEDGYFHCKYLSEEITSEDYIIQYKNTYEKVQKDSPGAGWVKGETVKNEWVNSGSQYNNEADLPTSDARILVKHIYYHFCGPNAGNEGNYEQTGKFVHYDEIDDSRYGVRIAS